MGKIRRVGNQRDDPFDEADFQLDGGQSQDPPACQRGLQVFLGVLGVAAAPVVPATPGKENAALDLDQGAALQVCEIRPPPAGRMEAYFPL